jgi:hypothetical protein
MINKTYRIYGNKFYYTGYNDVYATISLNFYPIYNQDIFLNILSQKPPLTSWSTSIDQSFSMLLI